MPDEREGLRRRKRAPGALARAHDIPRLVARDARTRRWRYLRSWHVWWTGRFSLVLTKAAVLHRDHFAAYRAPALAAARARVDAGRNCEDLLMACVVANATRAPRIRGA